MTRTMNAIASTVTALIVAVCLIMAMSQFEHQYNRYGTITEIDSQTVTFTDECGFEWQFEGEGFTVGEEVKAVMFDNCTSGNDFDDEIINIKRV